MRYCEIEKWLWSEAEKAADQWFQLQCADLFSRLYLWHKPGELRVAADKPEGFELSDGQRLGPGGEKREVMFKIHTLARRLPILTPEMAA